MECCTEWIRHLLYMTAIATSKQGGRRKRGGSKELIKLIDLVRIEWDISLSAEGLKGSSSRRHRPRCGREHRRSSRCWGSNRLSCPYCILHFCLLCQYRHSEMESSIVRREHLFQASRSIQWKLLRDASHHTKEAVLPNGLSCFLTSPRKLLSSLLPQQLPTEYFVDKDRWRQKAT